MKPDADFLRRAYPTLAAEVSELVADAVKRDPVAASSLVPEAEGAHIQEMESRVSRLEGSYDGIKHGQTAVWTVGGIVVAIAIGILGLQIWTLTKVDAISSDVAGQVQALRTEMAAEARATQQEMSGIATAIATGITAARQPAPPSTPAPQQE